MPVASIDLDWSGIRAAAVALGSVNRAAEQACRNLPPEEAERVRERINKRAYRERWLANPRADKAKTAIVQMVSKPLVQTVQTGANTLVSAQAEDERETRMSHSRLARKLAKQAESSEIVIQTPADVLALVKHYAVTHRIDQEKGGPRLILNQFNVQLGIEADVTDI